jgi:cytochrome c556
MKRVTGIVAGLLVLGLAVNLAANQAKTPSIKEVMKKAHDNKAGLRAQIKTEADKPNPDWADVQKLTKEFVQLTSALDGNKPPKGDAAAWKKQCQGYVEQVKALDAAAGKKDAAAVKAANQKLASNCGGCHKAHRE